ncbi:glycerophosphoryl diester phosphodiesterase membrane domain-containing protein [Arthrobacter sp. H41]|uniref:glycerophosphoryl diester phosphodiesterase membrane domain-containing protein n=1 Tax=Arthrobacter sp. H41 TaxID=1312978 RepID=UPI00138AE53C|nr:glycerophosphoryl diester phosphodiesterase membrane domain-containing protein [Arthrobacter sp. H41]
MGNHPQDGPPEDAAWHPPGALPSPAGGPDTGRIPRPGGNTGPTDQPYEPPSVPANQPYEPPSVPANQWGQPPQWRGYGPPQNGQNWQNGMYLAPPKPGVIPLRPLGLGEMLDGAFQACRRNPLATFGSAILFQAVVTVVTVLMTSGLFAALDQLDPETASTEDLGGFFATLASFTSVITVMSAAGLLILQGVLVIPVARAVLNQRTGFSLMWKLAGRRILPLVLLGLLLAVGTAVVLGVFVLISVGLAVALEAASLWIILPLFLGVVALGIWLGIKLVVAPAALMLEGTGPFASLRRSWVLTRRNWWRTFGIVVLTSIIVTIIASVISAPLAFLLPLFFSFSDSPLAMGADFSSSLPLLLVTQGITAFFTAIGYAFQAGVTALLYIDLRIRREGFDVVLMKEHEQSGGIPSDALPGTSVHFGHGSGGPRTGRP